MTQLDRALAEQVFREAVGACDPGRAVAEAVANNAAIRAIRAMSDAAAAKSAEQAAETKAAAFARSIANLSVRRIKGVDQTEPRARSPTTTPPRMRRDSSARPRDPRVMAFAIGKAALAMARGLGDVARGIAVTVADDHRVMPRGWRVMVTGHPQPDERSVEAGLAVQELVASSSERDLVVALLSGGASALVESPRGSIAEVRDVTVALLAAGAPIDELNTVRASLSTIKAGQLAASCAAPIHTYIASDVIGDRLDVVGSGPTIGPWLDTPGKPVTIDLDARRRAAIAVLERRGVAIPPTLRDSPGAAPSATGTPLAQLFGSRIVTREDRAEVVLPMRAFADAVRDSLASHGIAARVLDEPIAGEVDAIADRLVDEHGAPNSVSGEALALIAWGELTPRIPAQHGHGGRAQHVALAFAKRLRGGNRVAFAAGSDGIDGPPPRDRPSPAGAFVDGATWDALVSAGVDADGALARFDAGTALATVGALVITGPTGINHADVVVISGS